MIRSVITGFGHSFPKRVVTNEDLEKTVDTTSEWIIQRTGIKQRHIAGEGETSASLGEEAGRKAMARAGITADDLDLIIVATTTPDNTFPSTAVNIQSRLGMKHGAAFDLQAVCSGFIFALTTADMYLKGGMAKRILVIGAETMSKLMNWEDRTTCVLFGDGSGAVVLEAQENDGALSNRGILTTHLRSDGSHKDKLYVNGGPSTTQTVGHLKMQGKEVYKHAVGMITDVIEDAFNATNMTADDIDWFIPHQANKRIIDASAKKLNIHPSKVVINVDQTGNTSAASIPIALSQTAESGVIKPGQILLLEAMGGGFTWGSVMLRW
jgi:3-oxoacyl-[acyl-carrier-protein] synthase-3